MLLLVHDKNDSQQRRRDPHPSPLAEGLEIEAISWAVARTKTTFTARASNGPSRIASVLTNRAVEEVVDKRRHHVKLVFQREMSCAEQMQLGVGQITEVGPRAIRGEYLIVLAPDDQCRRLPVAEEGLEFRIERNIGSVVVEEVELDVLIAGAIKQRLVVAPIVRVDPGDVRDAISVLELGGGRRHKHR